MNKNFGKTCVTRQTLQKQWQKGDKEDQEDGNNTTSNPIENWNKIITPC
jgi:hypothetical protein